MSTNSRGAGPATPAPSYHSSPTQRSWSIICPSYQTPAISGYWGGHWTLDYANPDDLDSNGQREIASHFYPLTGPYDSQDSNILEYQVLLMKLSGIDGVIVNWYGIEDFADYGILNESTQALFNYIDMAQLFFSICYADYTIGNMIDAGYLDPDEGSTHGQEVMLYLQDTWFNDNTYLRLSGKPILLNFGLDYFHESSDWETLFLPLVSPPLFFSLNNRLAPVAAGAFPWPPMWLSEDGVLSQQALNNFLYNIYQESASWDYLVAGAWPGFHDYYYEAGLGFSFGYLDALGGETFRNTLDTAMHYNPDVIQIVTWNDYNEGTIVEPTAEFGYQYLAMIQDAKREFIDLSFPYTVENLEVPLQIFNLRKNYQFDPQVNQVLDDVFDLIIGGDLPSAVALVDSLNSLPVIVDENIDVPAK